MIMYNINRSLGNNAMESIAAEVELLDGLMLYIQL